MIFDADQPLVDAGVWRSFKGADFLIAHISNLKFQRALAKHQQPHRKKLEQGSLDPEVNRDITCRALSEGVLLNWRGVTDRQKSPVDYTAERGFIALSKNGELRDFVSEVAMNMGNYIEEEAESLEKP